MKTKAIIITVLTLVVSIANALPITLCYKYTTPNKNTDPITGQPIKKRSPVMPIIAEQDGHSLKLSSAFMGSTLEVVSNEMGIFKGYIDENGIVELPEELCGEYELRVYVGDAVYSACIIL